MLRLTSGLALVFALLFAFTGCAHYQLGTGTRVGFDTLFIPPVTNEANVPQAIALVTTEIRQTFLRDGRVRLVSSANEADAVLRINLVNYERNSAVGQTGDTGLTRKFDIVLTADCTLTKAGQDKPLFKDRRVTAEREIFTDGATQGAPYNGQLQAEYQVLPLLAETLAGKVKSATLDVW